MVLHFTWMAVWLHVKQAHRRQIAGGLAFLGYAVLSYVTWLSDYWLFAFPVIHFSFFIAIITTSVTLPGVLVAVWFLALFGLDFVAILLSFDQSMYTHAKGVISHIIIATIWIGSNARTRFEPFAKFDAIHGDDGGFSDDWNLSGLAKNHQSQAAENIKPTSQQAS